MALPTQEVLLILYFLIKGEKIAKHEFRVLLVKRTYLLTNYRRKDGDSCKYISYKYLRWLKECKMYIYTNGYYAIKMDNKGRLLIYF